MAGRILLVDDEVYAVEEIADYLRRRGRDVVATSDSAEGLRLVSADPSISIVITDLRMPNVDGFQIISEAARRKREPDRPMTIIALTGHGTHEDEQRAKSLGADAFLLKPIVLRELLKLLDQAA